MIPRIIHQVWLGEMPPPERWMRTWREHHPDWQYVLWRESDIDEMGLTTRAQYEMEPRLAGKTNYVRYEILLRYGGVYADADLVCLRPIDPLCRCEHGAWACWESERHRPGLIANTILAAEPGHRLYRELVLRSASMPRPPGPSWIVSGPYFLTAVARELQLPLTIYPSRYCLPEHYLDLAEAPEGDEVYCRHFWGSTTVGPRAGAGLYQEAGR